MKKIILLILFLISLKSSAQQTFWTPGVPPGSSSFSPTFRFNGTDSLAKIFLANGNKTYQIYTAVQVKKTFLAKSDTNGTVLTPYQIFHGDNTYYGNNVFTIDGSPALTVNHSTGSAISANGGNYSGSIGIYREDPDVALVMGRTRNSDVSSASLIFGSGYVTNFGIIVNDDINNAGMSYTSETYGTIGKTERKWIPYWGAVKDYVATAIAGGTPPIGTAGGDLSGTYPNPTVNTINGITKNYYDPTSSIQTQLNYSLNKAENLSDVANKDSSRLNLNASSFLPDNSYYPVYSETPQPKISLTNSALRDPSKIIKIGSTYYVYSTQVPNTAPNYPQGYQGTIYVYSSADLITWTVVGQVLGHGSTGDFDETGAFSPDVYYDGTNIYIAYTGVDGAFVFPTTINKKIGLAVSTSPTSGFTKLGVIIAPGSGGAWDSCPGQLDDASIVANNGSFRIYYSGGSNCTGNHKNTGFVSSNSMAGTWTKYSGNPVVNPVTYGYEAMEAACVFINNGRYNYISDAFTTGGVNTNAIPKLTSPDGINWVQSDPGVLISNNLQLGASAGVFSPGVYVENGVAKNLIYHFTNSGDMTLGIARLVRPVEKPGDTYGYAFEGISQPNGGLGLIGSSANIQYHIKNLSGSTNLRDFSISNNTTDLGKIDFRILNDDGTVHFTPLKLGSSFAEVNTTSGVSISGVTANLTGNFVTGSVANLIHGLQNTSAPSGSQAWALNANSGGTLLLQSLTDAKSFQKSVLQLTSAGLLTLPGYTVLNGIPYFSSTGGAITETAQGAANTLLHGNGSSAPSFSSVATGDISANAVTYAKIQTVTTNKLLGSGSGTAVAEITLGTNLSYSGNTLNAAGGGTVTSITPGPLFTSSTPITTSGSLIIDTTKVQTVLNFFPKGDTRYIKTGSAVTNVSSVNSDIAISGTTAAPILTFNRTQFPFSSFSGLAAGDVLTYNGSNWANIHPGVYVGKITLVAGVGTATITGLSTTSTATTGFVSIGGTVSTTWQYSITCTANTLTVTAITNAGTTDITDTSTLSYSATL